MSLAKAGVDVDVDLGHEIGANPDHLRQIAGAVNPLSLELGKVLTWQKVDEVETLGIDVDGEKQLVMLWLGDQDFARGVGRGRRRARLIHLLHRAVRADLDVPGQSSVRNIQWIVGIGGAVARERREKR